MKITQLESFLSNAGLRNYLFVRLTTDTGLTGIGEASLEWQELTVQTLIHEWVEDRILGADPFAIEQVIGDMIRDQYQGGSTIMTAISGIEIAMWDILGKACGQPLYQLLGGRARERFPAYANGWYGAARSPADYAKKALAVKNNGYPALKFDPFGIAWKDLTCDEMAHAEAIVVAIRSSVGDDIDLMIEVHGRLTVSSAIEMGQKLIPYRPAWYEEPVTPNSLEQLKKVKDALPFRIAAGERLYTLEDFERLCSMPAADIVQMDLAHCGGLHIGKKIAALAASHGLWISPHCSVGPVALATAVHFGWACPIVLIQENFSEYDVPWRKDYVFGQNFLKDGWFMLPDKPGLGIELNEDVCKKHPYKKNTFPSLWDKRWLEDFTRKDG